MAQQVENLDSILGRMSQQHETLGSILERALADPALLQRLADDPLGTVRDAGVGRTSASIKHWFGVPGATDAELVEMISKLIKARNCSGG
jgi:hypothetical protein